MSIKLNEISRQKKPHCFSEHSVQWLTIETPVYLGFDFTAAADIQITLDFYSAMKTDIWANLIVTTPESDYHSPELAKLMSKLANK